MSRGATQFEEYQLDRMNGLPIPSEEDLDVEDLDVRARKFLLLAKFKVEQKSYAEARLYAKKAIKCFFPDGEEVLESPSVVELGTEYLKRPGDRDITKERLIRDALGILALTYFYEDKYVTVDNIFNPREGRDPSPAIYDSFNLGLYHINILKSAGQQSQHWLDKNLKNLAGSNCEGLQKAIWGYPLAEDYLKARHARDLPSCVLFLQSLAAQLVIYALGSRLSNYFPFSLTLMWSLLYTMQAFELYAFPEKVVFFLKEHQKHSQFVAKLIASDGNQSAGMRLLAYLYGLYVILLSLNDVFFSSMLKKSSELPARVLLAFLVVGFGGFLADLSTYLSVPIHSVMLLMLAAKAYRLAAFNLMKYVHPLLAFCMGPEVKSSRDNFIAFLKASARVWAIRSWDYLLCSKTLSYDLTAVTLVSIVIDKESFSYGLVNPNENQLYTGDIFLPFPAAEKAVVLLSEEASSGAVFSPDASEYEKKCIDVKLPLNAGWLSVWEPRNLNADFCAVGSFISIDPTRIKSLSESRRIRMLKTMVCVHRDLLYRTRITGDEIGRLPGGKDWALLTPEGETLRGSRTMSTGSFFVCDRERDRRKGVVCHTVSPYTRRNEDEDSPKYILEYRNLFTHLVPGLTALAFSCCMADDFLQAAVYFLPTCIGSFYISKSIQHAYHGHVQPDCGRSVRKLFGMIDNAHQLAEEGGRRGFKNCSIQ